MAEAVLEDSSDIDLRFLFLEAGENKYFYVGHSKDLSRRMREHQYSKAKGHEDKYERIRSLEAAGTPWYSEIIETVPGENYFPDAERWHVIRLTREGHRLMNMRHGSIEHRRELADQVHAPYIRSVKDVSVDRQRRRFHKSKCLSRKIWKSTLRNEGLPNLESCSIAGVVPKKIACASRSWRRLQHLSRWFSSRGLCQPCKETVERSPGIPAI